MISNREPYPPEIFYLKKNYDLQNFGYLTLYYDKFKDKLFNISKNLYLLFNEENSLWEKHIAMHITLHFIKHLAIILEPLVKYYKKRIKVNVIYASLYKEIKYNKLFNLKNLSTLEPYIEDKFYNTSILSKLDTNKFYVPTQLNMIVDLRTGIATQRTHLDYFSYEISSIYNNYNNYNINNIEQYLDDILDLESKLFLQKLLGYYLTSITLERKLIVFAINDLDNSNILVNLLCKLLHNFVSYNYSNNNLIFENKNNIQEEYMRIMNKKIVFINQNSNRNKLQESLLKVLLKDYYIDTDNIIYNVTAKPILIAANITKIIVTPYIRKAILVIKFKDDNKKHKLKTLVKHLDELLVWLIIGSVRYFKEGLYDVPNKILEDSEAFLNFN
jgi:hypothetical protein